MKADNSAFQYEYSERVPELLSALNASLWITTHHSGKLLVIGANSGRLSLQPRTFDRAMGLAVQHDRVALASEWKIWHFRRAQHNHIEAMPTRQHFSPDWAKITGPIDLHELAWVGDELWGVNTAFSCLATFSPGASFEPRWFPPFIDSVTAGDHCHLSGLAVDDSGPRFVTMHAMTPDKDGWRTLPADADCIMDIRSGAVIQDGLMRPHSPRIRNWTTVRARFGTGSFVENPRRQGRCRDPCSGFRQRIVNHGRSGFHRRFSGP